MEFNSQFSSLGVLVLATRSSHVGQPGVGQSPAAQAERFNAGPSTGLWMIRSILPMTNQSTPAFLLRG